IISTAGDHLIVAFSALSEQPNLLNFKKFVVPMSLEVGRIIRGFERASTFNFKKLKCREKTTSRPPDVRHNTFCDYEIERRTGGARSCRRQKTQGRPSQSQYHLITGP
ncbi:hypothetical protein, partial [Pseudomonas putida]|uniref:hypothetical protein n=1 Tax=Pseudomonas putida TaxID=303 RepID=UPI0024E1872B